MPDVKRALVSDQVFRILCEGILSGRYAPGERLPPQRTLAADLGVNMASIREAVKRLEQLRLVEVRHGDAMRVRNWRADGGLDMIAHLLFRAGGLERGTLVALMEARRSLLGEAAALAAARGPRSAGTRLCELAERIAQAENADEALQLDFAFFSEIVDAAGNVVFTLVMNSIRQVYFERMPLFAPMVEDRRRLVSLYRRAASAIEQGSPGRASTAVRRLAEAQETGLLESVG